MKDSMTVLCLTAGCFLLLCCVVFLLPRFHRHTTYDKQYPNQCQCGKNDRYNHKRCINGDLSRYHSIHILYKRRIAPRAIRYYDPRYNVIRHERKQCRYQHTNARFGQRVCPHISYHHKHCPRHKQAHSRNPHRIMIIIQDMRLVSISCADEKQYIKPYSIPYHNQYPLMVLHCFGQSDLTDHDRHQDHRQPKCTRRSRCHKPLPARVGAADSKHGKKPYHIP